VRPGLDDKILVGWNGLLISGLLWAAHALGNGETAQRAKGATERAFRRLAPGTSSDSSLLAASIQKGKAKGNAYLDDYAFLARAAIDLFRFSEDSMAARKALDRAGEWIGRIFVNFSDPSGDPGFFFTADDHESLLQRPKSLYDQAIPSGTSVALAVALTGAELAEHDSRNDSKLGSCAQKARRHLEKLETALGANPFGYGELASSILLAEGGLRIFSGKGSCDAMTSPRDFVIPPPLPRSEESIQVCERGVCQDFASLEAWISSIIKIK